MDAFTVIHNLDLLALSRRIKVKLNESLEDLLLMADTAESMARQLGVADLISVALIRRAEILIDLSRYTEAVKVLGNARDELGSLRKADIAITIFSHLAECYGKLENWENADAICEEAIQEVEKYRYRVTAQYAQSGYLRFRLNPYTWGVRSAYELRNYENMLKRAELSKGRASLRYINYDKKEKSNIEEIELKFREVCNAIDQISAQRESTQLTKLLTERRILWELLSILRYQGISGQDLPEFNLKEIQNLLHKEEAILYYYWIDKHLLSITTIDNTRVESEIRELSREDRSKLEKLTNNILRISTPIHWLERKTEYFSSLLLPTSKLLNDKFKLIISPHKLLHVLPFHILKWQDKMLIDHFAIRSIPNLTSMLLKHPEYGLNHVFTLGIQEFNMEGVQPLTYGIQEADDIANLYKSQGIPTTPILGPDANEVELNQLVKNGNLKGCSCIHITTHGDNIPGDTPMESKLFLWDTILEGLEISNWRLNANLVVLSACCSGQRSIKGRGMEELPGDELFGLQAAFFASGCHQLVCALWPVDGNAAPKIMKSFHEKIIQRKAPEIALQQAMKTFRDEANIGMRKAYYWAPYFITTFG
jgi:CHAT domain-containing protein